MHSRKTLPLAFAAATAISLAGVPAVAFAVPTTPASPPVTATPTPTLKSLPVITPTGMPSMGGMVSVKPKPKPTDADDKGGNKDGDDGDGHDKQTDHKVETRFHHVPGKFVAEKEGEFDVVYANHGDQNYDFSELTLGVFADKKSSKGTEGHFFKLKYQYEDGNWRTADNCWEENTHEYRVQTCRLDNNHHQVRLHPHDEVHVHVKLTYDDDVTSPDSGVFAFPRMIIDREHFHSPVQGKGAHNQFDVVAPNTPPNEEPTSAPTGFPTTTATPTTAPTDQVDAANAGQTVKGGLAHTGADATLPIAVGAGAVVVAGAGLLVFARRRRGGSHV